MEEIGYRAFYHCVNLSGEIDIPKATKIIGNNAYRGCQSIVSLKFHENDTVEWVNNERVPWSGTIRSSAFSECPALTSVELAGSMGTLEDYAFNGCAALKEIVIQEGVEYLGAYFIAGTAVSKITVPSTANRSGTSSTNGALAGCGYLTEVTFAPGTKLIPAYICASQSQTSYLDTVSIPDSVEEIGYYAFYRCVNLGNMRLPASLKNLSDTAFPEASIDNLKIATEDSPAAITLIDLEIPFVVVISERL